MKRRTCNVTQLQLQTVVRWRLLDTVPRAVQPWWICCWCPIGSWQYSSQAQVNKKRFTLDQLRMELRSHTSGIFNAIQRLLSFASPDSDARLAAACEGLLLKTSRLARLDSKLARSKAKLDRLERLLPWVHPDLPLSRLLLSAEALGIPHMLAKVDTLPSLVSRSLSPSKHISPSNITRVMHECTLTRWLNNVCQETYLRWQKFCNFTYAGQGLPISRVEDDWFDLPFQVWKSIISSVGYHFIVFFFSAPERGKLSYVLLPSNIAFQRFHN